MRSIRGASSSDLDIELLPIATSSTMSRIRAESPRRTRPGPISSGPELLHDDLGDPILQRHAFLLPRSVPTNAAVRRARRCRGSAAMARSM
jgi:hypothetical protein